MALHVRWTGGKLVVLEVGPYLKVLRGGVVGYELEVAGRCPCHVELHDEDGCFNDEGDQFCEIYLQTRPPKWLVSHVTFITEANRFPELSITLLCIFSLRASFMTLLRILRMIAKKLLTSLSLILSAGSA